MGYTPAYPEVLVGEGKTILMLGNVAAARGFLEAGVQFVAAYPGTPSTEIVEALAYASKRLGGRPYVEWSVNEKVAVEAALGAAITGAKAVAIMKHVGLNVAADPFFSSAYLGINGALVITSADDPWMWSSQNEQDNRWYGLHAYVPVVEPLGAQEAREAARLTVEYSAKYHRPFMYRLTTRIAHTRVPVRTGALPDPESLVLKGDFEKNPAKWTLIPQYARQHRIELLEFWDRVRQELDNFPLNRVEGSGSIAVVGVGLGYRYAREAVVVLGLENDVTLYAVSTSVPLPIRIAEKVLEHEKILVVEEGDPVVEYQLKIALAEAGAKASVYGKSGKYRVLPAYGELGLEKVAAALATVAGVNPPDWVRIGAPRLGSSTIALPPRPPVLCPGCPYRSLFYALKRAVNKLGLKPVYSGDIGCYSLGILPPFEVQDTIINMGASIGAGSGIARSITREGRVVIAVIGDSTFFHSGLAGLANTLYNQTPLLILVLNNNATAMTGHQPHPGVGLNAWGEETRSITIEEAARGLGVEKVVTVNAFSIRDSEKGLVEALRYVVEERKPSVVVANGACILVALQNARKLKIKPPTYYVDETKCTGCGVCYTAFNCPAIIRQENGKATVDPSLCTGCGVCMQVCPFNAFKPVKEPEPEWSRIMLAAKPII